MSIFNQDISKQQVLSNFKINEFYDCILQHPQSSVISEEIEWIFVQYFRGLSLIDWWKKNYNNSEKRIINQKSEFVFFLNAFLNAEKKKGLYLGDIYYKLVRELKVKVWYSIFLNKLLHFLIFQGKSTKKIKYIAINTITVIDEELSNILEKIDNDDVNKSVYNFNHSKNNQDKEKEIANIYKLNETNIKNLIKIKTKRFL